MKNKALVVIDIQNDITKNYKEIIGNINVAIDWAVNSGMYVVYIKHNNLSVLTRTFKPGTRGAELDGCQTLGMVTSSNAEALGNLKNRRHEK